jgi:hypothetical protein
VAGLPSFKANWYSISQCSWNSCSYNCPHLVYKTNLDIMKGLNKQE